MHKLDKQMAKYVYGNPVKETANAIIQWQNELPRSVSKFWYTLRG